MLTAKYAILASNLEDLQDIVDIINLTINRQVIERVSTFKYLGANLNENWN